MTAVFLTPETFATVTDPNTSDTKVVLVDRTGFGYFEQSADGELPKPLLPELQPRDIGSVQSWIFSAQDEKKRIMLDAWLQMTDQGIDPITIARGMYWARANEVDDADVVKNQGVEATKRVSASSELIEKVLK